MLIFTVFHFETVLANQVLDQSTESSAASAEPVEKTQINLLLKDLSPQERLESISRAEVVDEKIDSIHRNNPEQISNIDMFSELNAICGNNGLKYGAKDDSYVNWPQINCKYHQDNKSLGGATNKFYCDFKETNKKGETIIKKRKVKYSSYFSVSRSELVPTILASTISRMLGFPTESYCPAIVKCENCSSDDPWKDKSSAAPSDETHKFKYAWIEKPIDLMTITSKSKNVSGFNWNELVHIQDTPSKTSREKLIEREAWLLWINFLADTDAHQLNERLSCKKASMSNGKVYCEKPIIYTHDYGHAFYYRFKYDKWKDHNPLLQGNDGKCYGGLTSKLLKSERGNTQDGIHVSPSISSEARDFLVSRLKRITKKQWQDMFRISNAEQIYRVDSNEFTDVIINKIISMERTHCDNFDQRTSTLSKEHQK